MQGDKHTYVKELFPRIYNIYNKNTKLRGTDSDYMFRDTHRRAWEYINLNDKELLDSYMKTHIAPWFKINKRIFRRHESVIVHLYADMDGNILEIGLHCPKDIKLPATAYEAFERAVLSGKLKLYTDKEKSSMFRNSSWVHQGIPYGPNTLKNMK